jgi:hypothetical protein
MAPKMTEHGLPLRFDKPRRVSPLVLAKIKTEVTRLANNGTRTGFRYAEKMFEAYPELRHG